MTPLRGKRSQLLQLLTMSRTCLHWWVHLHASWKHLSLWRFTFAGNEQVQGREIKRPHAATAESFHNLPQSRQSKSEERWVACHAGYLSQSSVNGGWLRCGVHTATIQNKFNVVRGTAHTHIVRIYNIPYFLCLKWEVKCPNHTSGSVVTPAVCAHLKISSWNNYALHISL